MLLLFAMLEIMESSQIRVMWSRESFFCVTWAPKYGHVVGVRWCADVLGFVCRGRLITWKEAMWPERQYIVCCNCVLHNTRELII